MYVLFCAEQEGELVATKESDLNMTSDLTNSFQDSRSSREATPPQKKTTPSPVPEEPSEAEEGDKIAQVLVNRGTSILGNFGVSHFVHC